MLAWCARLEERVRMVDRQRMGSSVGETETKALIIYKALDESAKAASVLQWLH